MKKFLVMQPDWLPAFGQVVAAPSVVASAVTELNLEPKFEALVDWEFGPYYSLVDLAEPFDSPLGSDLLVVISGLMEDHSQEFLGLAGSFVLAIC